MKIKLIFLIFSLITISTYSQTIEEFRKSKQSDFEAKRKEFDTFYQQKEAEFQKYLKQKWQEFEVFKGKQAYSNPKPEEIPVFKPQPKKEPKEIITKPAPEPIPIPQPEVMKDEKPEPEPPLIISKPASEIIPKTTFNFYGTEALADYHSFICPDPPDVFSGSNFAKWWKQTNNLNYRSLLVQLLDNKQKLQLNDWGYYKLVEKTASLMTQSEKQKILLQWFLLVKSGYDVRLAYLKKELSLFIPVKQQLYSKLYFDINGQYYYVFTDLNSDKINTYKKANPKAKKIMDFDLTKPLNIGNETQTSIQSFEFEHKKYDLKINYNNDWATFFSDHPQGEISIYFDATVSEEFRNSVLAELKPFVSKMEEHKAVNFILAYVQKAFAYKTDTDQFGYEKFFFAEENLRYPYTDCEDRAVYFAWLVRHLLDLEVIGLQYTGHVATAVLLHGQTQGDYIVYQGKKYTIADPTFIGAPMGFTMDMYKLEIPGIIPFKNLKD